MTIMAFIIFVFVFIGNYMSNIYFCKNRSVDQVDLRKLVMDIIDPN